MARSDGRWRDAGLLIGSLILSYAILCMMLILQIALGRGGIYTALRWREPTVLAMAVGVVGLYMAVWLNQKSALHEAKNVRDADRALMWALLFAAMPALAIGMNAYAAFAYREPVGELIEGQVRYALPMLWMLLFLMLTPIEHFAECLVLRRRLSTASQSGQNDRKGGVAA